jgi:two-component system, cell cycle sensor histidine kinase and response regulator CckA
LSVNTGKGAAMHDVISPTETDQAKGTPSANLRMRSSAAAGSGESAGLTGAALTPSSAELIAAQQLGNVGLLAAGLAHDLNNLLTVILGSAELALDHIPAPSPARHNLRTIEVTVRRAAEMCRAMLACARTDRQTIEAVDANAIVRDTVSLLQTSRLGFHRVRLDLASELPPVPANAAQFRQIVLNLLANAADACGPRGGRIRVSTMTTKLDARAARRLRPGGVAAGNFLRLRVADDGCGMDEATQQKLFTPFFSSKAEGRGLGLASLLEIARAHGGGVRVFSEPSRGAIFDVFLPVGSETPAATHTPENTQPTAASPNERPLRGTVLIADDEEILRQSLKMFLSAQGLTVHDVENGEAALAFLNHNPDTDLVLLDLMMPKIDGIDALTTLRSAGRQTPVILMTGHADVVVSDRVAGLEPVVVLTKPFSLAELLRVIGEFVPQHTGD